MPTKPPAKRPVLLPSPRALSRTRADRAATAWLEGYNPLRGLTLRRAQMIFDAARRGNDVRLQWIYENIEQADPTLMVCAERRAAALADLDWTIRPKAAGRARGFDETLAREQCALLEHAYGDAEEVNLLPALEHLAKAFFRGHAHARALWSADGLTLRGFETFNAWNLCRDLETGCWHWNPAASETLDFAALEPVPPGELVTLVRTRHIDYPALAIYLRNGLGEREWGRFLERYGIPPVLITMPQDIDAAQVDAFCARAVEMADGGSGALPFGSVVTYAQEARGVNPFREFLDHQQQLVVLMATGGMLTSLTGATGIGQGATQAHEETWRAIVRRDAAAIATALNRTVTDALLDRAFPGRPHLAAFDFQTRPEPGPAELFDLAAKAVQAGYRVAQDELEERTGFRLEPNAPADQSPFTDYHLPLTNRHLPLTNHPLPITNRAPAADSGLGALAEALRTDCAPLAEALRALLAEPSPTAAQALAGRLPELLPDDPEMAAAIEEALTQTFGDALATAPEKPAVANRAYRRDPDGKFARVDHPGSGQREPETKGKRDGFGTTDEAALAANPRTNKARAQSVVSHLLAKKEGAEPKALYRQDTGWVGIDYGTPGNAANDHKGGHGLAHILAKHPKAKDTLVDTLQEGEAYKHDRSRSKLYLIHGNSVAVLTKHRTGRLLITDYGELSDKEVERRKVGGRYHTKGEN